MRCFDTRVDTESQGAADETLKDVRD